MRKKHDGKNKKLIALLVALGMAMQMAGCGQEETSDEAIGNMSVGQTDDATEPQAAGTELDQIAAGQESEDAPNAEEPEFADYAIEWKNYLVERAVRENVQIPTEMLC